MAISSDAENRRDQVARDYEDAIRKTASACGCSKPDGKGAVAPAAGYRAEDLADLPQGLEQSSFGCGNPLAFGEVQAGEVVLDLGAGAGLDLLIAARKVGPTGRVIGIDMTAAMVREARRNVERAGLDNVEVRLGLIEDLPLDDASVDWVISNCVINLSPEKERVFAEIARVLKPGGHVRVSDIVARELPDEARESAALVSCCLGGAIPEEAYAEGLRQAGLVDVEVAERIVYDASQLAALAGGGNEGEPGAGSCCGTPASGGDDRQIARSLEGNVWSAQFRARKP